MTKSTELTELVFQEELTEQGLKNLRAQYPKDLVVDMSNDADFKAARKIRTERNKLCDAIKRRRLDVTKELKDYSDELVGEVNSIYDVVVVPFEIEDQRRKEIEAEKARKLEMILNKQREEIAGIRNFLADAGTASPEAISGMLDAVGNIDATDFHKDLIHEVMETIKDVKNQLASMMVTRIEAERLAEEHRIAEEARKESEAKLAEEALRGQIADRINKLQMIPMSVMGEPSGVIQSKINSIGRVEITVDSFGDRHQEAIEARDLVIAQLDKMLKMAQQMEALTPKPELEIVEESVPLAADPSPAELLQIEGITTGLALVNKEPSSNSNHCEIDAWGIKYNIPAHAMDELEAILDKYLSQ